MNHEQELQRLREEVRQLRDRLEDVSRRLEGLLKTDSREFVPPVAPPPLPDLPRVGAQHAVPLPAAPPILAAPPPIAHRPQPTAPTESFEVRLGTVWLPRIGMTLLLMGMVFFAMYYFPRLSKGHKVALSYACCAILCALGVWLEKRTMQLARVLFAGGLALTYFVTYAAHHVAALRVIQNPAVGLALLSVVVVGIIVIAQNRQSPLLAGLALFFGYYTSIISEVATFTLAANALLAVAALFFLWRNRWVPISYLAVLATYLAYMLWVWRLNEGVELGKLLFDQDYLSVEDFRLRAAFLSLYWLLFSAGGLIVHRDAMELPERKGLLTLNNAFFFILFALLMHHAHADRQWVFFFCFGGVLLVTSTLANRRFAPDRSTMDLLFLQGVIVATLGVMDYFESVHLVAALAVETLLLLLLARAMQSPGVGWIGRAVYLIAFFIALDDLVDLNSRVFPSAWFAAATGLFCTSIDKRTDRSIRAAGLCLAFCAAALAVVTATAQFDRIIWPWTWITEAVLIAGLGAAMRTREIVWAANLPLLWAFIKFLAAAGDNRFWPLDQSLGLIAVIFGFGVVAWARSRRMLLPYGIAGLVAVVATTVEYCPERWQLTAFAVETAVLVGAGAMARERVFVWLGLVATLIGFLKYLGDYREVFDARYSGWLNLACSLWILGGVENLLEWRGSRAGLSETAVRRTGACIIGIMTAQAIFAIRYLVDQPFQSVGWAICGFGFLVVGFLTKERPYRIGGLVALGFALLRVVFYDLGQLSTPYRILSLIALGAILLVLAFLYARNREKLARWL